MKLLSLGFGALCSMSLAGVAVAETGPKVTHQYGADATYQLLDSYSPSGSGHPILVYVHGGSWHVGSKDNNVDNKKEGLIGSEDYVLVSVEYRRNGNPPTHSWTWKDQSQDVADAIQWVHDNANSLGGDNQNIFLIGHSAGAQMTGLVAYDDGFGIRNSVNGIALLDSGDYDVVEGYNYCTGSSCAKYGQFWDSYNLTSMSDGSPVNHADNNTVAPTIIVHRSTSNKIDQANWLGAAILAGGQTNVEKRSTTDSHSVINEFVGSAGRTYTTQISDFFDGLITSGGATSTLLEDGFESFNSESWTTDAMTTTSQVFDGTYALRCGKDSTEIVSREIDASALDTMDISFNYRDHGIDNSDDVFLQFYDGVTYVNQVELGTSASNNTWTQYSTTLDRNTDPFFFYNNFKIRIDCDGIDNFENLRIDDVLITGTQ